jgi:ABC-2 type transport system ATP-binding protein
MEPVLEVSKLTRRFGDRIAVRELSFGIDGPQTVGLLGVNGAGKTTTLRLLCGFLYPEEGSVRVAGFDLAQEPREARRRMGYLAEGAPALPEMRVESYLRFRARLKGLGRRVPAEVDRVIERCGLGAERRAVIGQLSRGFRQRVGLADALLGSPPLLLLDEPASGLDPAQVRDLRAVLAGLDGECTVLLSSHALAEVETLCRRVLVLHQGTLVADGPPQSLQGAGSARRLLLEVRAEPSRAKEVLAGIDGLGAIEVRALGDGRCRVVAPIFRGDPRAEVARALCAAGLDLLELRGSPASLEEVFLRLVAGAET